MKRITLMMFFLLTSFYIFSCVEPYEKTFFTTNKILIVEGLISNEAGLKPVMITESYPSESGSSRILPVKGAIVNILIDGTEKVNLTEKEEGVYYFNENFRGEIGKAYQIQITGADGNKYESSSEKINFPVPIKQISHLLDESAISDAKGNTSAGYKLYVDIDDPKGVKNQYLWDWTLYERQNVCKTCSGGYYYRTPLPLGACVEDALLKRYNNIFDYNCEADCWEIMRSIDLNAISDEFADGNTLKNQFIGKIPLYQYIGALLYINQYSISKSAYSFISLSQQQGVKTGGLADTPPAQLKGNIKCLTDPTINTSGFFIVAGKSNASYWLNKEDAFEKKLKTVGLFGGRELKLEPATANTTRPPLAPCVNSLNRTNQKPVGWIN